MTTATFEMESPLERLLNDRRVRVVALIVGVAIIAASFGLVSASQTTRTTRSVQVLPDQPINIPLMRQWPYPRPEIAEQQVTRVTSTKAASKPARRARRR